MDEAAIRLSFEGGSILVEGGEESVLETLPNCRLDPRNGQYRAEGRHYRALVEHLRKEKIAYTDDARNYEPVTWNLVDQREPFPHQVEGMETWWRQRGQGLVVLPTGTGKTFLAMLAIRKA